jgi:hypothetical protein
MDSIGNFQKKFGISVISVVKSKNIIVIAFTYCTVCVGKFFPVFGNFCMDLFSVDNNEAMKQGNEELNASLIQF